jgi:hydrogenase-4 component E
MNSAWLDPCLVTVLLLNFLLLGATRLKPVVYAIAAQGIVLGLMLPIVHPGYDRRAGLLTAATIVLRGIFIPRLLFFAMRRADVRWRVESLIGPIPSLLFGAAGTAIALNYADSLPLNTAHTNNLVVPTALATVLTAFIILITRYKAINLVLGYMVLENGIFVFGLLLIEAMPFLVEIGVLLDLFVGVFLMGIVIHHVAREVESAGVESLPSLRE